MNKSKSKATENMIYSLDQHIPLGQATKTPTGEYAILVKYKTRTELVFVDQLVSDIRQVADSAQQHIAS